MDSNLADGKSLTPFKLAMQIEFKDGIKQLLESEKVDPVLQYSKFYDPILKLLKKGEFKLALILMKREEVKVQMVNCY